MKPVIGQWYVLKPEIQQRALDGFPTNTNFNSEMKIHLNEPLQFVSEYNGSQGDKEIKGNFTNKYFGRTWVYHFRDLMELCTLTEDEKLLDSLLKEA